MSRTLARRASPKAPLAAQPTLPGLAASPAAAQESGDGPSFSPVTWERLLNAVCTIATAPTPGAMGRVRSAAMSRLESSGHPADARRPDRASAGSRLHPTALRDESHHATAVLRYDERR